jgi:ribonuclease D
LTDEQLAYAAADTRHLLPLADKLEEKLRAAGRSAWMEEECDLLRLREPADRVFDPEGYRSLPGAKKLGVAGRRVLRALFTWREEEARARDVPPFRVLPNDVLVLVSGRIDREGALDAQALAKIKRVPAEDDRAHVIADVIRAGLEVEEPPEGERLRDAGEKKVDRERFKARMDRMRKIRSEQATKLGIAPGFLVSAALLERIAREPPPTLDALRAVRGFTAWRVDVVGEELLAALRP